MCKCFPAFRAQDPAINQLRHKIRYALDDDNPGLLPLWLAMEESLDCCCNSANWQLYHAEYRLLLDALSDDLLPGHWRSWCLDNISKPLMSLQRIAISREQSQQLNKLFYELRVVSHFFQGGLT
ncbi:MAG: hypothetical protein OFPII_23020 [Osedax symbiont Rs1]|nr:MAG: hypothetical protein OFPII_23020 [Osedax symbiont Rs1]